MLNNQPDLRLRKRLESRRHGPHRVRQAPRGCSPGASPRIDIFSQIKAFKKNKHSHIDDVASIIFMKLR
jgi:hypothetical protein